MFAELGTSKIKDFISRHSALLTAGIIMVVIIVYCMVRK